MIEELELTDMKNELQWLEHFVSVIHSAQAADQISKAVHQAFRSLGFDDVQISIHRHDARDLTTDPDVATRKDGFLEEFNRQRWYERDSKVTKSMSCDKGFWSRTGTDDSDPIKREHIEFLTHFNVFTGLVIPLHSKEGLFSSLAATSSQFLPEDARSLSKATVLAKAAAMRLELVGKSEIVTSDEAQALRRLSSQQIEILKWASEGKSNAAIAIILGLSKAGIDYHVRAIIAKLGVASRTQAALMLKNGHLNL